MKQVNARRVISALGAALLVTFSAFAHADDQPNFASAGTIEGRIKSMSVDSAVMKFERLPDLTVFQLSAQAIDIPLIKEVPLGTVLRIEVDDALRPAKITRVDEVSVQIGAYPRILAIGGSFVVLLGLATLATRGRPLQFLVGLDGRYSNSQSQLVLWFGAVAVVYVATVLLRIIYLKGSFIGGVGVTANVIALTGLSAVSFGGAKVITTQKTTSLDAAPGVPLKVAAENPAPPKAPPKKSGDEPNLLTDLFQNDRGDADFGDFQMILVTLAAVAVFVSSCFAFLGNLWPDVSVTLPDIDTTLLSAFGVGQGAYLLKKAAMRPGEG